MSDYSEYDNKRVIVTVNLDEPNDQGESIEEIEGTVSVGNEMGLLIKPKGKSTLDLIEAGSIEKIELAPETPKKLQVKSLLAPKSGVNRQHLLDRHGYTVDDIEAMAEVDAQEFHEDLDHAPLGHNHDKVEATEDNEPEADAPAETLSEV